MHDDPAKTTPLGMVRYAHDFLVAAQSVRERAGVNSAIPSMPELYLMGHSIELSLKAYLLQQGISLHDVRGKKLGHDLHACLRKGNALGLSQLATFTGPELGAFELLNGLYSTKQLEYIVIGKKYVPLPPLVESFAVRLLAAVAAAIGYEADPPIEGASF